MMGIGGMSDERDAAGAAPEPGAAGALMPFYLAFGLATGWLARRSGSLRPALLLHGLNNGLACLALLVKAGQSTA